jgi:Secretion system C-terminal sorting domain
VGDVLHFAGDATVTGITIIDASGRVVLQSKSANDIVVSNLSAGIYYVTVRWASGSTIQKMVKK